MSSILFPTFSEPERHCTDIFSTHACDQRNSTNGMHHENCPNVRTLHSFSETGASTGRNLSLRIAFRSDGVIEGNVFHSEERFFSSFKIGFGLDVNYKNLKKNNRSAWDSNPQSLAAECRKLLRKDYHNRKLTCCHYTSRPTLELA